MFDGVGTTRYSYDAAGQLFSADGPWNDDTVSHSYANRLTNIVSRAPLDHLPNQSPGGSSLPAPASRTVRLAMDNSRNHRPGPNPAPSPWGRTGLLSGVPLTKEGVAGSRAFKPGHALVILAALCFLSGSECLAQIQQAWVNRYSLDSSRTNQATALTLAPGGNIVVAGSSSSTNGDLDYLVTQYAPNGQQLWLARLDLATNSSDQLRGMALDTNGNVFLTGTSKTAKLNSGGSLLWDAPYGGRAVATDAGGNAYVTGFSELDYATVKLDPSGSNLWLRTFSYITYTNVPDVSQFVAVGPNGTVAVSGYETHYILSYRQTWWVRTIAYDSAGNQLWSANSPCDSTLNESGQPAALVVDGSGRVFVAANVNPWNAYCTTLYDSAGAVMWSWYLDADEGPAYFGYAPAMAVDAAGSAYLTGSRVLGDVCLTVKITNGHKAWISTYHGAASGKNQGNAIAVDSAGNIYVAAYSPGNGTGNDIVTLKYDNNGNQLWVQRYNGPANGDDIPTAIAVDSQGGVYVTGYSATTNGGTEFVTLKYAALQNIQKNSDGSIELQFFGTPSQAYAFYASTNFAAWSQIGSATADSNGIVQFTDTSAPSFPSRFYRRYPLP